MIISPYDGSVLAQTSAEYFLSRNWTVGFYLGGVMGNTDTIEGSLPWSTSGVLQVVRYCRVFFAHTDHCRSVPCNE